MSYHQSRVDAFRRVALRLVNLPGMTREKFASLLSVTVPQMRPIWYPTKELRGDRWWERHLFCQTSILRKLAEDSNTYDDLKNDIDIIDGKAVVPGAMIGPYLAFWNSYEGGVLHLSALVITEQPFNEMHGNEDAYYTSYRKRATGGIWNSEGMIEEVGSNCIFRPKLVRGSTIQLASFVSNVSNTLYQRGVGIFSTSETEIYASSIYIRRLHLDIDPKIIFEHDIEWDRKDVNDMFGIFGKYIYNIQNPKIEIDWLLLFTSNVCKEDGVIVAGKKLPSPRATSRDQEARFNAKEL